MTLKEIAEALVDGCRTGKERENLDRLYHPDAVSVEAADYTGQGRETAGLDGIRGKHDWWDARWRCIRQRSRDPFLHGDDRFAVIFDIDATDRASGQRMPMREVAVYHVADGRIVREEFFGMG
jgi:ketosteroid isomerase-like protein